MNTNLDTIAQDLYGKISVRFDDIKIGDEHGEVLVKKTDIPQARFFEFEYKEHGDDLGTVTITLDEDDGIIVQVSGKLEDSHHKGAFKFIRGLRMFAKDRLLNFDVQNIGKDQLDQRDYEFQAKPKEEIMAPMMESKMYGTSKISYQDLGEARLIVKHTQPVNTDIAAGRTMHIDSIYVENADGERFKYPVKHLNGARALAEHLKHGGYPWDSIGKHITNLSEELAQLRKFKGYVGRNESLAEAMGDITSKVMERIEEVKKEIHNLQRPTYYTKFAESFTDQGETIIPEAIMNDWIDRLTVRTFNEELKTAFPYIFRLVDESEIPVKELEPEDLLNDAYNPNSVAAQHARDLKTHHRAELKKKADAGDERAKAMLKHAEARDEAQRREFDARMERESYIPGHALDEDGNAPINGNAQCRICHTPYAKHFRFDPEGDVNGKITSTTIRGLCGRVPQDFPDLNTVSEAAGARQAAIAISKKKAKKVSESPADYLENFLNQILEDNADLGPNDEEWGEGIFDADPKEAIDELNDLLSKDLTPGVGGANLEILKKLVPDESFIAKIDEIADITKDSSDEPINQTIKVAMHEVAQANENLAKILNLGLIDFEGNGDVGGEETPQTSAEAGAVPPAAPPAPEAGAVPPAPEAGAVPPGPEAGAVPPGPEATPTPPPVAESSELARWLKIAGLKESVQVNNPKDVKQTQNPDGSTTVTPKEPGGRVHATIPPAPGAAAQATPPATQGSGKVNPTRESAVIKAIHKALECGAGPDTVLDFGHKQQTLLSCIEECGMDPQAFGLEASENGLEQMLKDISGFWNHEKKNFTIGGTRAKIKVLKSYKDGEYAGATDEDVAKVLQMINHIDPSSGHDEVKHISHLAHGHESTIDEDPENDQFDSLMRQFTSANPEANIGQILQQFMKSHPEIKMPAGSDTGATTSPGKIPGTWGDMSSFQDPSAMIKNTSKMPGAKVSNTSSGTINGQPASYDDAMKNMPKVSFGGQDFDFNNPDDMGKKIQGMVGNQFNKIQGQVPNQNVQFPGGSMNPQDMMKGIMSKMPKGGINEDPELTAMLKIAGLR